MEGSKFGLWDNGKSEDVRLSLSRKVQSSKVEIQLGNQDRVLDRVDKNSKTWQQSLSLVAFRTFWA